MFVLEPDEEGVTEGDSLQTGGPGRVSDMCVTEIMYSVHSSVRSSLSLPPPAPHTIAELFPLAVLIFEGLIIYYPSVWIVLLSFHLLICICSKSSIGRRSNVP